VSFEIQELPDILRVIILLSLTEKCECEKSDLKRRVSKYLRGYAPIDEEEMSEALEEMVEEGLILNENDKFRLSELGIKIRKEWESLLLKKEPLLELIAGLTDGTITGLVVILSEFLAGVKAELAIFTAFLALGAVAITNFSSFMLGGRTEDAADLLTLKNLINFSLGDIPDKEERNKSLIIVKNLFTILQKETIKTNLISALICGITTFLAGSVPILAFLTLPSPENLFLSTGIIVSLIGIFLVFYRSKRSKINLKVALFETLIIISIAVLASLVLGQSI